MINKMRHNVARKKKMMRDNKRQRKSDEWDNDCYSCSDQDTLHLCKECPAVVCNRCVMKYDYHLTKKYWTCEICKYQRENYVLTPGKTRSGAMMMSPLATSGNVGGSDGAGDGRGNKDVAIHRRPLVEGTGVLMDAQEDGDYKEEKEEVVTQGALMGSRECAETPLT